MDATHPELRRAVRFLPSLSVGPGLSWLARSLGGLAKPQPPPAGITVENRVIAGPAGALRVRLYRPAAPTAAMVWIHGGGFVLGTPEQDERTSLQYALQLGIVVVAVDYRLGPKHPYPAPLDDCYAALKWLHDEAEALGVRRERLIVAGASAGGGLAAGLSLLARDRGEVKPCFQVLVYPMLDDRTVTRADQDVSNVHVWSPGSNRFGWRSYLGQEPGSADVSPYAAPARMEHLAGLPPTWLGVGTTDLFFDEDVAYAARLTAQGVACEFVEVKGAYHAFDVLVPGSDVVKTFFKSQVDALRAALAR